MVISDCHRQTPIPLLEALSLASRAGAWIQLRDKAASAVELLSFAQGLRARLPEAQLLINDRADIALAAQAQGLHLPESGIPVSAAKARWGEQLLIGASVHGLDAALQAQTDGADYLLVGTMFPTASKPGKIPEGPKLLKQITDAVSIPCLAIGGIQASNVHEVAEAGAAGVAVISFVLDDEDPGERATELIEGFSRIYDLYVMSTCKPN